MNKQGKIISILLVVFATIIAVGFAVAGHKNSCSDSDGGIYINIFGTATGYQGGTYYIQPDTCVNSGTVREYYCSGTTMLNQALSCGTDSYSAYYCSNDDVYSDLTDYVCSSGACSSSTYPVLIQDCGAYGYCSNGVCYSNNTCSDTDGGVNLAVAGTASGTYNGVPFSNADYCVSSTVLAENYCAGTTPYTYNANCTGNYTQCSSGACI